MSKVECPNQANFPSVNISELKSLDGNGPLGFLSSSWNTQSVMEASVLGERVLTDVAS